MTQVQGWSDELLERKAAIDTHLRRYFDELSFSFGADASANAQQALQLLSEFTLRPGKRIRGVLGMIGYEMFGGDSQTTALDVAVCLELAQAYLLIIDDVMDHSKQRRGGETVHRQYQGLLQKAHFSTKDGEHIGEMLAINVGLVAQHLAGRLLGQVDADPARVVQAISLYGHNMMVTGLGQLDDMFHAAGQSATVADICHKYIQKTGYYTFVNPLQVGAALAGAAAKDMEQLRLFGEQAGVAFQVRDDIIGMFGDAEVSGKSAMDDLREGKVTLLMQAGLQRASRPEQATIRAALGNASVSLEQYQAVQTVLQACGALAYAEDQAYAAAQAARAVLDRQEKWDPPAQQFLSGLLEFIVNRRH